MTLSCKLATLFLLKLIVIGLGCVQETCAQQPPTVLSGFTNDEIFAIQDDRPLSSNNKNLARLLYRVQQCSQKSLLDFARGNEAIRLDQIAADPRSYRCYVFRFSGYAQSVYKQSNADAESDDTFKNFDLVRCKTPDNADFLVAVPNSGRPKRWPENKALNEPIIFSGFFLANYDFHSENKRNGYIGIDDLDSTGAPLFVSNQIEWFPEVTSDLFDVSESEILLSKFGVNIAKLDHVKTNILGKIDRKASDSFYQILNAVSQMTITDFPAVTFDFKECIQRPKKFQSAPMRLHGQIRRVTEIPVANSIFNNGEINKYYQLDVFVPLGDHKIVFRSPDSNSDEDVQVHENRFPVTVCVTELPLPKKQMKRKNVSISCFFFQRWNYEPQQSAKQIDMPFQDAPLAIGIKPQLIVPAESPLNFWIGVFGLTSLLGIGGLYLVYGRTSSVHSSSNGGRQRDLPGQIDVSNLSD